MTGCRFALALFSLAGLMVGGTARAAEDEPRVYVGVYLHDVTRIDAADGVFDADVELWARWLGEFDPVQLQVANGVDIDRTLVEHDEDGAWHSARWRVRGTFGGEFPVQRFPFDEQTIAVVLEVPEHLGILVPDVASSGVPDRFSLPSWHLETGLRPALSSREVATDLGDLAREGGSTTVGRVAYRVGMARPAGPVLIKLFLPLGIVVLVALAALFVDPRKVGARSTVGAVALLSCFAFRFAVAGSQPAVATPTVADTLFSVVVAIVAAALVVTIATHVLARGERARLALAIDRVSRLLVPAGGLIAVWLVLPPPLPELDPVPSVDPMPEFARSPSSRDTIRIGTTLLSSVQVTPASTAAHWPVLYDDPWEGIQPVFVERAPGVHNDALRFLDGGQMEVTWRIREGMAWSDGTPLTSADMAFVLEAMPDPGLVEVTTPDERTLVVRWSDHLAAALDPTWAWPSHVLRPVYESGGLDAVFEAKRDNPQPSLGPYQIVEFDKNSHLEATANPRFPGPPPAIPTLEMVYYDDRDRLAADFEAGKVDMVTPNAVSLGQAEELAARMPDAVHVRSSAIFIYLHPDLENPLLANRQVRQGIAMALNRKRLSRKIYDSVGDIAHVPAPGEPPEGTTIWTFDEKEAEDLIEEGGARKAKIKLMHGRSSTDRDIAEIVAGDLEDVGLRIDLVEVDSTFKTVLAGGHGGLVISVDSALRDSDPRRWWNLPVVEGAYPDDLRHDAYTDEIHALVEKERRALYPERREQLRDALLAEYSEALPTIPLIFAAERILADPDLTNWDLGSGVLFGRGAERWTFETAEPSVESGPATQVTGGE